MQEMDIDMSGAVAGADPPKKRISVCLASTVEWEATMLLLETLACLLGTLCFRESGWKSLAEMGLEVLVR